MRVIASACPFPVISQSPVVKPSLGTVHSNCAPAIEVTIGVHDGEALVRIAGEASVRSANALEARLLPLSARWPHLVTLDLSDLRFLSALGLGVLVAFRQGVVRAGGKVQIAPTLQPQVREVFDATGLTTLFARHESSEAHRVA